jgi:hypothetical protein
MDECKSKLNDIRSAVDSLEEWASSAADSNAIGTNARLRSVMLNAAEYLTGLPDDRGFIRELIELLRREAAK